MLLHTHCCLPGLLPGCLTSSLAGAPHLCHPAQPTPCAPWHCSLPVPSTLQVNSRHAQPHCPLHHVQFAVAVCSMFHFCKSCIQLRSSAGAQHDF